MRSDLTDITMILDRSGSMHTTRDDTIGGFNSFLLQQRAIPGQCNLSLIQFDHQYEVVYSCRAIADAPLLTRETFVPRGNTALLDAIGRAMSETGHRLSLMEERDRPGRVLVVIITDGYENCSSEYTHDRILDQIRVQSDVYSWQFVYLGANQDAIKTGARIGICSRSSMTYAANGIGTRAAFSSLGAYSASVRAGNTAAAFTDADRQQQSAAANEK